MKTSIALFFGVTYGVLFFFSNDFNQALIVGCTAIFAFRSWFEV